MTPAFEVDHIGPLDRKIALLDSIFPPEDVTSSSEPITATLIVAGIAFLENRHETVDLPDRHSGHGACSSRRRGERMHQRCDHWGIAGHVAGHGKVGAVAGCIIGRHEANKRDAQKGDQKEAPSAPRNNRL